MAELRAQGNETLDNLIHQHALEIEESLRRIDELTRKWKDECESLVKDKDILSIRWKETTKLLGSNEFEHNSTVERLRREHSSELKRLNEKHYAELALREQMHATATRNLKREHSVALSQIDKKLEESQLRSSRILQEKEAEHSAIVENLKNEISGLKAMCQISMNDLEKMKDALCTAGKADKERKVQIHELDSDLMAVKNNETILNRKLSAIITEGEKREKKLIDLKNENIMLRNQLKV